MKLKPCPHAHRCVHPCDVDECFLETIEQPNGPPIKVTKEVCDRFEEMIQSWESRQELLQKLLFQKMDDRVYNSHAVKKHKEC